MNIKEELTCKYCHEIYKNPIILNCCGENICRQHIDELISVSLSNKLTCPICNAEISNQTFCVNKLIERLLEKELHKLKIDTKYKDTLESFKIEVGRFESVLKEPENFIHEEISELKRQVDLDREKLKSKIDDLADNLIKQLDSYEKKFKAEYKTNVDLVYFNELVESSKKQLEEYEKFLGLFSVSNEEREKQSKESENLIETLQQNLKELKEKLFLNKTIKYKQTRNNLENLFGMLIIKVSFINLILHFNRVVNLHQLIILN